MSATYQTLVETHGVLMTYQALAAVMNRSPDGLRLSLAANRADWARQLNQAKVRMGRRVLFRTEKVAAVIDAAGE